MTIYSNLSLKSLADVDQFVVPKKNELLLDSPATTVMTDFNVIEPQIIFSDVQIDQAIQLMQNSHFWMKLVLEPSTKKFIGIVLLRDLLSRKAITKTTEHGIDREELTVQDLMHPKSDLFALCVYQLEEATIGDIINTLKSHGEQYCLVLDSNKNHIRGIISSNEIRKKLGVQLLNIFNKPHSFSEIFDYINHKVI